ncbi:AMP-binding protein [Kitasatospora sp. NPDC056327]|uniref:AMP-binding protein n=1 Tax=Kitasatospora sp. NPDC056327 TaxID=3345785 RepID=UPI0035E08849
MTVLDERMRAVPLSLRELEEAAAGVAARLRGAGVRPADRVCVLAPTSPAMLVHLFGLWRLGAVVVVLPHERLDDTERLRAVLAARTETAGARVLLTSPALAARVRAAVPAGVRLLTFDATAAHPRAPLPPAPDAADLALLQFTSGSTGPSKAVVVRHGQLVGNIRTCMETLDMRPGDTYVSWLPFYHDMGIVSVTGLLVHGVHAVLLPTETFLRRPASWLETVSARRAEITAAPDSAYRLAVRAQQLRPAALDLSRLRVAIDGAEAVHADTLAGVREVLGACGLPDGALRPTYGMAETTLVVTAARGPAGARVVEPGLLPAQLGPHPVPARALASCGAPLPGTRVSVHAADGSVLPEGQIGEVRVSGPGVTDGYWTAAHAPLDDGAGRLGGGRMDTGDLGFLHDGELYVCGRVKDIIIVGGRNLYPEDYESAAEGVPGVRGGNVIAFSLPGEERMVVVAEVAGGAAGHERVARELFERLRAAAQYAPAEVVLIRPTTLPRTSSGKKRRGACRERYLAGELAVLAVAR